MPNDKVKSDAKIKAAEKNQRLFYERLAKILGMPPEAAHWNKESGEPDKPFEFSILQAAEHFAATEGYVEAEPIAHHPDLQPLFCSYCGRLHPVEFCPRKRDGD